MRGRIAALALAAVIFLGGVYWFALRSTSGPGPQRQPRRLAAVIGSGSGAVAVAADGTVVRGVPLPRHPPLPRLPLSAPPKGGRVVGPALEQVRVLAAAPRPLRRFLAGSRYGKGGVDVELTSGVELRFGDAARAGRKWRAAAAVLADPTVTALDYVDVQAPSHPTIGGGEHELPPAP